MMVIAGTASATEGRLLVVTVAKRRNLQLGSPRRMGPRNKTGHVQLLPIDRPYERWARRASPLIPLIRPNRSAATGPTNNSQFFARTGAKTRPKPSPPGYRCRGTSIFCCRSSLGHLRPNASIGNSDKMADGCFSQWVAPVTVTKPRATLSKSGVLVCKEKACLR